MLGWWSVQSFGRGKWEALRLGFRSLRKEPPVGGKASFFRMDMRDSALYATAVLRPQQDSLRKPVRHRILA